MVFHFPLQHGCDNQKVSLGDSWQGKGGKRQWIQCNLVVLGWILSSPSGGEPAALGEAALCKGSGEMYCIGTWCAEAAAFRHCLQDWVFSPRNIWPRMAASCVDVDVRLWTLLFQGFRFTFTHTNTAWQNRIISTLCPFSPHNFQSDNNQKKHTHTPGNSKTFISRL